MRVALLVVGASALLRCIEIPAFLGRNLAPPGPDLNSLPPRAFQSRFILCGSNEALGASKTWVLLFNGVNLCLISFDSEPATMQIRLPLQLTLYGGFFQAFWC